MAKLHGRFTELYFAGINMSGDSNSIEVNNTQDVAESSGFGQTRKSYVTGLIDASATHNGLFNDEATTGIHDALRQRLGSDSILTVVYGTGSGRFGWAGTVTLTNYSADSSIGGAVAVTANYQSAGTTGIEPVTTLFGRDTLGTTASSERDDGAQSTNGMRVYQHVFSVSAGTVQTKVQHATASGGPWVDLSPTFTAATARTAEFITITGTINQFLRVINNATGTGVVHVATRRL